MQAFLYFNLATPATYRQPLLEQVKAALPQVAILDMDTKSGELVQRYALQLLRDAAQAVVVIKADESITDLSALMPLLEELFLEKPERLVLLQGAQARLQRMLSARQNLKYKVVAEEEVVPEAQEFFQSN
ncbi:hypothetical protein ABID22_000391 [Pontibacter aydingkolensis]|uniref:STAS domain-containing protein n=1 Tax=Pontibacter aydingkolensis TaxID=1911536 RepID=A0ABS7CQ57_9BACT|nr:hypothetical protein [Pontibacter aydingkolensis]MBW7465945.1 hypothetical protein [Pontibacter aydingkolensis]